MDENMTENMTKAEIATAIKEATGNDVDPEKHTKAELLELAAKINAGASEGAEPAEATVEVYLADDAPVAALVVSAAGGARVQRARRDRKSKKLQPNQRFARIPESEYRRLKDRYKLVRA